MCLVCNLFILLRNWWDLPLLLGVQNIYLFLMLSGGRLWDKLTSRPGASKHFYISLSSILIEIFHHVVTQDFRDLTSDWKLQKQSSNTHTKEPRQGRIRESSRRGWKHLRFTIVIADDRNNEKRKFFRYWVTNNKLTQRNEIRR